MTALLDLAAQYYAVADDLRRRGEHALHVGGELAKYADALCEQNIRDTAAKPVGVCDIEQYAGIWTCYAHKRSWGAHRDSDQPCEGWVKP